MNIVTSSTRKTKTNSIAIGTRFNRWTVTGNSFMQGKPGKKQRTYYPCECDCGTKADVLAQNLRNGISTSCGCKHRSEFKERVTVHGDSHSLLYYRWRSMRNRCQNPKFNDYDNYGGRGISVCDEWQSYKNFKRWAVSSGFAENLTLDRIDVNGNYEPSNCRWVSQAQQTRNVRTNIMLTAFGETKCLMDWASDVRCKASYSTMQSRIKNCGWTDHEKIIATPAAKKR